MAQALADQLEDQVKLQRYRWTPERYLQAWEAGVFKGQRVELLDGEVVKMSPMKDWHGDTVGWLFRHLPDTSSGLIFTCATLVSGTSAPDPDIWVRAGGAKPKKQVTKEFNTWHPTDVLLIVEVANTTKAKDLTIKARIYSAAGYPEYWVVTKDTVYVHRQPSPQGYKSRVLYGPGEEIPIPYAPGQTLAVNSVIGSSVIGRTD